MKTVEYIQLLTPTDKVRVRFRTKKGKVTSFSVQYYAFINGYWRPIVRYDTAHGFAHKDIYRLRGRQYTVVLSRDILNYGHILTDGLRNIKNNFDKIKVQYLNKKP